MTLTPLEANGKKPEGWVLSLTEDQRRAVSLWLAWVMWSSTATLTLLRAVGVMPAQYGAITVLTIGVAIAASLSRSRMRLADAFAETFETGLKVGTILQTNVTASACLVEIDCDGDILAVEHAEVIGWDRDALCSKPLDILIPDRYLRQHQEGFRRFRDSGDVAGATVNIPVLTQTGDERGIRLSVARLGDCFLGTLVPIPPSQQMSPAWMDENGNGSLA